MGLDGFKVGHAHQTFVQKTLVLVVMKTKVAPLSIKLIVCHRVCGTGVSGVLKLIVIRRMVAVVWVVLVTLIS